MLVCTAEQEAAINALLPPNIQVRAFDGKLGSDLLTECGEGGLFAAAAHIIQSLPVAPEAPSA